MSREDLPSIDEFVESNELPSVEDAIIEEELPSIDDYIEKEEIVEEIVEEPEIPEDLDLTEVLRLINDVRRDIPDVPEIKYYDEELKALAEQVSQISGSIPEVKYYDNEVEAICDQIDLVKEQIKDLPEVKYYDEQVGVIEDRIDNLQTALANLPEVKYYDAEIEAICDAVDAVKASIPKFPKWVNEVNEVPDFSWIGKTFSVIDDDFTKVGDSIQEIKNKINYEVQELTESISTKDFETRVDIKEITENLENTKNKIYEELKETAIKIWDHHHEFKDDDRKLKKQILSHYNSLKQNVNKQVLELREKTYESDKEISEKFLNYFDNLKDEIASLPEVKYYDDDVIGLRKNLSELTKKFDSHVINIAELYKIVNDLKGTQQDLTESLAEPANTKQGQDPLTPTDQNFATLDDLQKHYRLFVGRIQEQIAALGGGGETKLQYLDDIVGIATNLDAYDGMYLQVDVGLGRTSGHSFKFSEVTVGAAGTWAATAAGIHTTKNVGIATTARSEYSLYVGRSSTAGAGSSIVAYFEGDVSIAGTVFKENIQNVDSIGVVTARSGINVGYDYLGGPGVGATIEANGNANFAGVVTSTNLQVSTLFTPPVLTTAQRVGLSTLEGSMIYNSTDKKMQFFDGTSWNDLGGVSLGLAIALDG